MKRLYVVYGPDDRPFAETERLRFAYDQALECIHNNWWPISIDIYLWEWRRWYRRECSYGDFYFIDKRNEAILPEDLLDMWVIRKNIISCETEEELKKFVDIAQLFELEFNDYAKDVYSRFYSLNAKRRWEKSQS